MAFQTENISNIPAYIFGSESSLVEQMHSVVAVENGVQMWFLGVALVVAALYLGWLNYWCMKGGMHGALLTIFGDLRGKYFTTFDEYPPSFNTYIASGALLGIITVSIAIASFTKIAVEQTLMLYTVVLGVVAAIYFFQLLIIYSAGQLTSQSDFFGVLAKLKSGCYSVGGMTTIPSVLCYSLCEGGLQDVFMYIVGFQLLVVACIFFYKTFVLFLSKKVSVLHTILYLCAVEIFPITLIWGFFYR